MMKARTLLLILLASCGPDAPPPSRPPPPVRLPPEIQASIAALKEDEAELVKQRAVLQQEISGLEARRLELEAATGKARYMLKLRLKQSHFSLDLDDHLKDAMNTAEFWIAVDQEMYDSVSPGSEILDKFRVGSLIMNGSFGSWHIKVLEKKIAKK